MQKFNNAILELFLKLNLEDEIIDAKIAECDQCDEKATHFLSLLNTSNPIESNPNTFESAVVPSQATESRNFKLPKITLPTFSNGKNEFP